MADDSLSAVASLAGAIVIARGAQSIPDIQQAWIDAGWIVHPAPDSAAFVAWQHAQGGVTHTPEQDEAIADAKMRLAEATRHLLPD